MRKLLAGAVSAVLVLAVAVVFLGSTPPACLRNQISLGEDAGIDVPADPAPVANPSAPLTARVATWNALYTNSTGRIIDGLTTIARESDVIGVQEFNSASRRAAVARAMAKKGWGVSAGNNSVQIFYNATKYKLLAQDSVKVIDVVRIESGTAGTSIGPKSLQWIQLQDRRTLAVFFVVNHHIVPDIDRKGRRRDGAPKRLAVRDKQRATALSVIAKLRPYGPVALTEDSNVDNRNDQRVQDPRFDYVQMKQAGMASNWTALGMPSYGTQTSGRRLIDKVSLTMENGRFLAQKRLPAFGSDHHAVVATITNSTPAAAPVNTGPTAAAPSTAALPTALAVPGWKLDQEQIEIAAMAIEVGKQLGIPERGWIVAVASGLQESGLRNLPRGDRDSAGWQQQRPSAGWGSYEQVTDIRLATQAFYGLAEHTNNPGLVDIQGWRQRSIAAAAQAVQGSAFPSAYQQQEEAARAIVAKLANTTGTGTTVGADDCTPEASSGISGECPATGLGVEAGLQPDALLVLRCTKQQFPAITSIGGVRPDPLPDHPSGRALDLMIPDYQTSRGKAFGWQVARWLQANQQQLGVKYAIFDNKIWNIERNDEGWRVYRSSGQGTASMLHTNHVHVTVYGNSARPDGPSDPVAAGAWYTPVGQPSSVGCGVGCYSGHTGQDYPAPPGTPVYAVNAGTVIRSESITSSGNCAALPSCGGTKISYGNLIVIKLAGGGEVTAWYAHLTERRVRVGDTVRSGQVIGTVGYQGNVRPTGPRGSHLHFEIRKNGTPADPLTYLRTKGIQS